MVCFKNKYKTVVFRITFIVYLLGIIFFWNGLISPTVVNLESTPVEFLLKECANDIKTELCSVQYQFHQHHYSNHYNKIVVIVIDALRADFIPFIRQNKKFNTTMVFTEQLLSEGKAISFVTQGFAPTVTLPRIKTLVTGTVSSFLDIIMNFNAVEINTDNVIKQAKLHGLNSVFYGDETWVKLFPNSFIRSEGTHSFFVTDFVEVDFNVSRHIKREIKLKDWKVMILHFLGVDHIGHAHSPFSEYLPKKLNEMDEIVHSIYEDLKNDELPSLIIVCGDHGMTNLGSHGGLTEDELLTPLIYIDTFKHNASSVKSVDTIHQVDFAPTLSAILGVPIPASNFGNVIPNVLQFIEFSKERIIFYTFYNFLQLLKVYEKAFSKTPNINLIKETTFEHLKWLKSNETNIVVKNKQYANILKSYTVLLNEMKLDLLNSITGYNVPLMIAGILIMWLSLLHSFYALLSYDIDKRGILQNWYKKMETQTKYIIIFAVIYFIYKKMYLEMSFSLLCYALFLTVCKIFILYKQTNNVYYIKNFDKITLFFIIIHSISLFSSSYIEEEHQTWYFLSLTLVILVSFKRFYNAFYLLVKSSKPPYTHCFKIYWNNHSSSLFSMVSFLIFHRISRKWNQVGNKWQHLPDISDWLNEKENAPFLIFLLIISQIFILYYFKNFLSGVNYNLFTVGIICIILKQFKSINESFFIPNYVTSFIIPWIVYLFIVIMIFLTYIQTYSHSFVSKADKIKYIFINFVTQWILLAEIISRAHNVPLLTISLIQEFLLNKLLWTQDSDKITNSICYMMMAKTSYFWHGNSNSISTIDVFTGYTGVLSYMPLVVAFLIMCNTYSTFVLWLLMLVYRFIKFHLNEDFENISKNVKCTFIFLVEYKLFIVSLYSIVMVLMRHHLFIYSVFFPKLIYEICFTVCFCSIYIFISFLIGRA